MTNLKDLQKQLTKDQIIEALKAKVLRGGVGGINCPPPYGVINCPPPYGA